MIYNIEAPNVDMTKELQFALHWAVHASNYEAIFLREHGADLNSSENSFLLKALTMCDMYMVDFLIQRGCDVNLRQSSGTTPLLFAVKERKVVAIHFFKVS